MTTAKKHKKDSLTATVLIVVFALALAVILALPYLANIKSVVDSAFLSPEVFAQLAPDEQADAYQKSYENAQLLGGAIRQFYLAFALQFFLLLIMAVWTKVLLRRYGKALNAIGWNCKNDAPLPAKAATATEPAPAVTQPRTSETTHYSGNG